VIFFTKIIAWAIMNFLRSDDDEGPSPMLYFGLQMVIQIGLGFLGMIVVAWFSRKREYRADIGGAQLAGTNKMIAALQKLKSNSQVFGDKNEALATMKISGRKSSVFSTHPDLDDRISALKNMV
jgi:heat shock protein HtpX